MSNRRLQFVAIALSTMLLAFVALASAKNSQRAARVTNPQNCPASHIQEIRLPVPMPIDEIRVNVDAHSPSHGATNVYVWDGELTRVLRIRGQASQRLTFSPPIVNHRLHVSLEPVYTAPVGACVRQVELRVNGALVAAVRP